MAQTKGIIRDRSDELMIFRPINPGTQVKCYHDSYSDTYCVPGYMSEWKSKSELALDGWRFVDGEQSIYLGIDPVTVIYDSDNSD